MSREEKEKFSSKNCKCPFLPTLKTFVLGNMSTIYDSTMNIDSHYISYLTNLLVCNSSVATESIFDVASSCRNG